MTSQVIVKAHCAADKQVKIKVGGQGIKLINDGETFECYVHDEVMVAVREVPRVDEAPAPVKRRGRPPAEGV
jgi:hypothetical protein